MKILVSLSAFLIGFVVFVGIAIAVDFTLGDKANNPNVVAYYPNGLHGIVGEEGDPHTGEDLVMKSGESGDFEQWFWGTSPDEGLHGDHSVWLLKKTPACPDDFILVPNAYPAWGDYLTPGADYCVKTNDFDANNSGL